ncbi:uncharacterized protein LOC114883112 [Osmia bicornis bicornis]|uniref:uncharacterized protein LOC114883112 n=1 Tax=Osmia bicornis bicornis TaxID=1437191 RepID=UPI001EAE84F6|nr:uncharacterized protein LOC114883112 [Osmia bicornis bicornis]XP_029056384.2 uncharacterized protein LOC114883112 [Osmia bicornis bicornis]
MGLTAEIITNNEESLLKDVLVSNDHCGNHRVKAVHFSPTTVVTAQSVPRTLCMRSGLYQGQVFTLLPCNLPTFWLLAIQRLDLSCVDLIRILLDKEETQRKYLINIIIHSESSTHLHE